MWVKFVSEFRHRFTPQMKRRYMPGEVLNVPSPVAEKAIAAGAAVRMKKPARSSKPEVDDGEAAERG